jgi:type IX secretion system PorP/SprF family membrane protein
MKKYLFLSTVLFLIFFSTPDMKGQDVNFSQWFSAPLYFNPAYTGLATGLRGRFLFRDQWPNLPVDFKSYYFSADIGDRRLPGSGGVGLVIESDNEGISFIHDLSVGLNLSVRIPIATNLISQVGIKAAVVQKRVNYDELVFTDQLSAQYGNIYQSSFIPPDASKRVFPDFGAGGILQFANEQGNMNGTVGLAVDHIFQPDESFLSTGTSPLPRKFIAHADFVISAGGGSSSAYYSSNSEYDLKVNPGIIYQNQASMSALEVGLNMLKYNIYIGAWYKSTLKDIPSSAIALLAGYRYTFAQDMSIKFMYSYDLQISSNLQGLGGAHEVSLILEFDKLSLFGGNGGGGGGYNMPARSRGAGYSPLECPSFY